MEPHPVITLAAFRDWLKEIQDPLALGTSETWQVLLSKWRFEDDAILSAFAEYADNGRWPDDAATRSAVFTGLNVGAEELRLVVEAAHGDAPLSDQKLGFRFLVMRTYQTWTHETSSPGQDDVGRFLAGILEINAQVAQLERQVSA